MATLDSLLCQTYRPLDVIVVDDGSTDDTEEVVGAWIEDHVKESDDFSFRLIRQQNAGPSAARNRGMLESRGDFVQFLDSDDLLHSEKLAIQVARLTETGTQFCVCNYRTFGPLPDDNEQTVNLSIRSHQIDDFPAIYPMNTPAPLYRRDALLAAGPWAEYLHAGEDFEFNFRVMTRAGKGIWIEDVLLDVRRHNSSERIQASPIKDRYSSMYHGLVAMEIEAVEQGVCSRRFLRSIALRALDYRRHLNAEGSCDQARVFERFAQSKLSWNDNLRYLFRDDVYRPLCRKYLPGGIRKWMPSSLTK